MQVGKAGLDNVVSAGRAQLATRNSKIEWTDFNYPPGLRVIHFSLKELKEPHLPVVKRLFVLHLIQCLHFCYNLINLIIQVAMGTTFVRLIASPLFFVPLCAVSTATMYYGYRGVCEDSSLLWRYKAGFAVILVLHLIMVIPDAVCFNGFVRVSNLFKAKLAFPAVLCLIESIAILVVDALSLSVFFTIHRWGHPPVNY